MYYGRRRHGVNNITYCKEYVLLTTIHYAYCYFYSHLLCGYDTLVRIDTKAHRGLPSGALAILQRRQVPLHTSLQSK
jgi:hypothetical protein